MNWHPFVAGIVPSIGVGLLFWYAMRGVLRADRNERAALAAADAEYEAKKAAIAKSDNVQSPAIAESDNTTEGS